MMKYHSAMAGWCIANVTHAKLVVQTQRTADKPLSLNIPFSVGSMSNISIFRACSKASRQALALTALKSEEHTLFIV